jgi:hypothetical protein
MVRILMMAVVLGELELPENIQDDTPRSENGSKEKIDLHLMREWGNLGESKPDLI